MHIDEFYDKKILFELLVFNDIADILRTIEITESEIINDWIAYIKDF